MKRHVLILGLIGGILIAVLKWTEYQFIVIDHSMEIYGLLTAITFSVVGIWLGLKLTRPAPTPAPTIVVQQVRAPFVLDDTRRDSLGITRREMEILQLVAQGLTNREISEKLFVSENTVKTHCARAFDKVGARRRTQAVQMGKELGLLP